MKRARAEHPRNNSEPRLDLGLSSILSSFEPLPVSQLSSSSQAPTPAVSEPNFILIGDPGACANISSNTSSAGSRGEDAAVAPEQRVTISEYAALASENRWEDLNVLCESRLGRKDRTPSEVLGGYEARLWWVRSQLARGGVPSSILAAPLDSVSEGMLQLSRGAAGSDPERKQLCDLTSLLLQEVSGLLISNKEYTLGLSFLERAYRLGADIGADLLAEVEADLHRTAEDPRKSRSAKGKERVLKLEALRKELKADRIKAAKPAITPASDVSAAEAESQERAVATSRRPSKPFLVLGTAGLLGALALLIFPDARSGLLVRPVAEIAQAAISPDRRPDILLPEVQRISSLSSLDALFYDIDASRARVDTQRAAAVSHPASGNLPVETRAVASSSPGVSLAKAVVNTSGPIEGPEFAQARSEEQERGARRSDELFNPARAAIPVKVEGMEVEKFEADRLFIVIAKTSVMARPSFQTASLAELQTGDKVLVEAKIGPWLKLRSKQGQSGYILAQDAELSKTSR